MNNTGVHSFLELIQKLNFATLKQWIIKQNFS